MSNRRDISLWRTYPEFKKILVNASSETLQSITTECSRELKSREPYDYPPKIGWTVGDILKYLRGEKQ